MSVVSDYAEITRRLALLNMTPQRDAPAWWGCGTRNQWTLVIAPPDPAWGELPPGALSVTGHCALLPEVWVPDRRTRHRYIWTPRDEVDLPTVAFRSVCFALDGWERNFSPYLGPGVGGIE